MLPHYDPRFIKEKKKRGLGWRRWSETESEGASFPREPIHKE